jgi:hypothetical protein
LLLLLQAYDLLQMPNLLLAASDRTTSNLAKKFSSLLAVVVMRSEQEFTSYGLLTFEKPSIQ